VVQDVMWPSEPASTLARGGRHAVGRGLWVCARAVAERPPSEQGKERKQPTPIGVRGSAPTTAALRPPAAGRRAVPLKVWIPSLPPSHMSSVGGAPLPGPPRRFLWCFAVAAVLVCVRKSWAESARRRAVGYWGLREGW
jgi:hypothetical protein